MPRRREIPKRELAADPLYNSTLVSKFINTVMSDGKRSTAERILYQSFDIIKEKTGDDPLKVFKKALDNVKPSLEVKSRRVGGSNYQVPVEVNPNRRLSLSIRWLVELRALARRRQDDAGEAGERAAGRGEPARRRREEARRHAPDGGGEQGLRALPLVATRDDRPKSKTNRFQQCHGRHHSNRRGTSASWPTSMPARPRRRRGSSSTPVLRTRSARSTRAPPSWTGWSRNRSAASRSRRPRRPASGATSGSTSSTRRATSTSRPKSSARCACSTARARCSTPCRASSRSRKPCGGRRTSTACRASASSTRWTASAPTSSGRSSRSRRSWAPTRLRSSSRSAAKTSSRA